jgi:hypothetical protein
MFTDTQPKLSKGESLGFLSAGVHLAPARLSGYQVCASASKGCTFACLNLTGMGIFSSTQAARIKKTKWLFEARPEFMAKLAKEVQRIMRKAFRKEMTPAFRLNLTSDVRWELIPVTVNGVEHPNVMSAFPDRQFYDYTKHRNRIGKANIPKNYHLTFSRSEDVTLEECVSMIDAGTNVAVVFNVPKDKPLPTTFMGRPVIDGRVTDLRFLDPVGVWVGLSALGRGKKDTSGFVVNV